MHIIYILSVDLTHRRQATRLSNMKLRGTFKWTNHSIQVSELFAPNTSTILFQSEQVFKRKDPTTTREVIITSKSSSRHIEILTVPSLAYDDDGVLAVAEEMISVTLLGAWNSQCPWVFTHNLTWYRNFLWQKQQVKDILTLTWFFFLCFKPWWSFWNSGFWLESWGGSVWQ